MKYLILGAGPAGLSVANKLKQLGEDSFVVLEKECHAGGLCRSVEVDGSPFDIGGGHFLDERWPYVNEFLFQFMAEEEWNKFNRDSRIVVKDNTISHPIESNIWQMDIDSQIDYLKSIASAGCNVGRTMPEKFIDWIYWKLGEKIAEDYMIPYNQKMFGSELDQLGTYWLEKLPNVSFEETLRSCLEKKAYGTQPGHAKFYYPKKYGYGELWLRMADSISNNMEFNKEVVSIDFEQKAVITGDGDRYKAKKIISTIPWTSIKKFIGMPSGLQNDIKRLRHSSLQTEYYKETLDTNAHWIYYPDPQLSFHRILIRHNFCLGSKGYWTETNSNRIDENMKSEFRYLNKYAYPLNTTDKPMIMKKLLTWTEEHDVIGLGRWGEHQHYNSDVTVKKALELAQCLI